MASDNSRKLTAQTDWHRYHNYLKQTTLGKIPQIFHWRAYKQLLAKISFQKNMDILELGCGTGLNTLKICKNFDIGSVTLVDMNVSALNISSSFFKKINIKKTFINSNVNEFHTGKKFDLVHSHGLIEHFPVPLRNELIKKHIHFLKPGGYLIIFVPTPIKNYNRFRKLCETLHVWPFPDEIPITEADLVNQIIKNDIQIIDSIIYTFLYPTLGILAKKSH
jgi:cyclopropane fatty-acyl-phospholipid synthase-like methyltransferase